MNYWLSIKTMISKGIVEIKCQVVSKIFPIILTLICLIKLFLTRTSEIVASPSDPQNYLSRAERAVWFSDGIGILNLGHPPGYSLFVWLVSFTGIPLRIFHELFYIFSVFLLIYSIRLLKVPKIVCVLVFSLLIFYPLTFRFFNDARSEAITVSLFNILIALIIFLLFKKKISEKIIYSCLAGLTLGFIGITRPEKGIEYIYMLSLIPIMFLTKPQWKLREKIQQSCFLVFLPLLVFIMVNFAIVSLNSIFLGVPGVSLWNAPSFKGMYTGLMKIDAGTPVRQVPINPAQLEAAYQVSPSFKTLEPFLPKEEIRGKFTVWLLADAVRDSINPVNPRSVTTRQVYQKFTEINQELKTAFRNRLLPTKAFGFSYIDPNFGIWLPHLKESSIKVITKFLYPPFSEVEKIFLVDDPKASITLFNKVANRRAAWTGKERPSRIRLLLVKVITRAIHIINTIGIISIVFLLIYYFYSKPKSPLLSNYVFILLFIIVINFLRLLLYSLVDASLLLVHMRYSFPGMPLFSAFSLLNIFVVVNLFWKKLKKPKLIFVK